MGDIDTMRTAAQPVTLQIGSLSVQVVVTRFEPDYHHDAYIPYSIECQPMGVMNLQGGGATASGLSTVSLAGSIDDGLDFGDSCSCAASATTQTAMSPAALAANDTPPTYVTNTEFGSAAQAPVGAIISQMASPSTAASTALSAASQIIHLVQSGESLWSIATQYYSSGTQWTQIAQANGIQNPSAITAGQQLTIPNPTQGTG
jgi:LysM repeat protein